MLKRLFQWLKQFYQFLLGRKQTPVLRLTTGNAVQPPALTNADLEFLFTELLEGVYQGRGQQWAGKYLQRMEHRISVDRWIEWLLDFGERLLTSPVPNHQLAERMMQLGQMNIGTVGDLSYDIGIRLLTRNLSDYWDDGQQNNTSIFADAPETIPRTNVTTRERDVVENTLVPASTEVSRWESPWLTNSQIADSGNSPTEEDAWVAQSLQAAVADWDYWSNLPPESNTELGDLLVMLEETGNAVPQLPVNWTVSTSQTEENQAQEWFCQGLQLAKTGDLQGAIAAYNQAIALDGQIYEYWFNRGLTLFYLNNFTEAVKSYDQTLHLKPDFHKAWYNRGAALGELQRFEEAISCFDRALELKPNYLEAISSRSLALLKLGYPGEAIASYNQALELEPDDPISWYYRGVALAETGQTRPALADYNEALAIYPEFHLAWYSKGLALVELSAWEEAQTCYETAIKIQPNFPEAWYALGGVQEKLAQKEAAIHAYAQATRIKPDFHDAWLDQGVVLGSLGRWQEAIVTWERAIALKRDFYLTWYNRGIGLDNIGEKEQAIVSYEKCLEINPDFYFAWYNRAVSLFALGRYEEAIASCDGALQIQPEYWEAWIGRGNAVGYSDRHNPQFSNLHTLTRENPELNQRGEVGKLATYGTALQYIHPQFHPEGYSRLHLAIGNTYYDMGMRNLAPREFWLQAQQYYNQALVTIDFDIHPYLYLEVLQSLTKVLVNLGEITQAQINNERSLSSLQSLLMDENRTEEQKKQLALKFSTIGQLSVDIAVQLGELAQAWEIAEYWKNACFTWLLFDWNQEISYLNYSQVQQLLNPQTAIIYWHISPSSLRTFIIKYNSTEPIPIFTPVIDGNYFAEPPIPEDTLRLIEFTDWLKSWQEAYQEYQNISEDKQSKHQHHWRLQMENYLARLGEILNISAIIHELEDITHLIIIPHCSLHKLPLHALFHLSPQTTNFTTSYLPSVQIGIYLKSADLLQNREKKFLSIEHPNNTDYASLKFAKIESEIISQMFNKPLRLQGLQATKKQVSQNLEQNYNILHFTGQTTENASSPLLSGLILAESENLNLGEIFQRSLTAYNLVTLSISGLETPEKQVITGEYANLITGFLSQGIPFVVSNLWNVESAASAVVMIEFYRRVHQGYPPEVAMAETVQWLQELTAEELTKWYEDLLKNLPQEGLRIRTHLATEQYKVSQMHPQERLYQHPYHWAGFTVSGR
ncbi:CHAT domain-containing protein [Calothrix sp. 336/3]|uniref:CHAT domain-containing protein n=1 Tax=Calothrix sp. 336/3 TaxID=1337936 RepID=UPI0004E39E7E|nr:tetratricopeptide repeat protein [Calothrix sp. 336/3]AKG21065.1 hypothetical protein IJ00_06935 [Calothrix sp. 336/3]